MTGEEFLRLRLGREIEVDGKTYEVMDKDNLGRVKLQKKVYSFHDGFGYDDYDTFDEAEDARAAAVDDADSDEEAEELAEREIDCRLDRFSAPFWMSYKDIEED